MNITIIGGSNIDITGYSNNKIISNDSNIGKIETTYGGVARNICENLLRLKNKVTFITAIGNDLNGLKMKKELKKLGAKIICPKTNLPSSSYLSIIDSNGEMREAICDNEIIKKINLPFLKENKNVLEKSDLILFDCNLEQSTIEYICRTYKNKNLFADATSANKVIRLKNVLDKISFLKMNNVEFNTLKISKNCMPKLLLITGGKNNDVILKTKNGDKHFPIKKINKIVNSTGCGDSLVAGIIHAISKNKSINDAVNFGLKCSAITLMSKDAVNKKISSLKLK